VTLRWGDSPILQQPVLSVTLRHLANSMLLAGIALIVIVPTALVLGVYAALRRDRASTA
jgi:peptide/nickel transport system permease protein